MSESFKYSGNISQKYIFKKFNKTLSTTIFCELDFSKSIECPVSAYAFSNVDAFGSQALCWHNDLSDDITAVVKASADLMLADDEKFGSAWNQISANAIADADNIKQHGWMNVNARYLSK